MSVLFFTNAQIQIYRFRQVSGLNKWTMSATLTTYQADIQPADPERVQLLSGQVGQRYVGFVDSIVSVNEGDELRVVGDTKKYSVKGVSRWEGAGLIDHRELDLVVEGGDQ